MVLGSINIVMCAIIVSPVQMYTGDTGTSRRYASAASTDTSSFNKTDTQTYLYCQVAIINGIIDNITDIISLPSWQYLLMPMSLLPMRRYTYITVSVQGRIQDFFPGGSGGTQCHKDAAGGRYGGGFGGSPPRKLRI